MIAEDFGLDDYYTIYICFDYIHFIWGFSYLTIPSQISLYLPQLKDFHIGPQ